MILEILKKYDRAVVSLIVGGSVIYGGWFTFKSLVADVADIKPRVVQLENAIIRQGEINLNVKEWMKEMKDDVRNIKMRRAQ